MVAAVQRRNGAVWPPHPLQAASWVLFSGLVASYYALFLAGLDDAAGGRAAAGAVFGFFALSAFVAAATATLIDPADRNIFLPPGAYDGRPLPPGLLYCHRCERHVAETSKHCVVCHKCVDVFDHHCVWLGNCVGLHNYMAFIAALIAAGGMLVVQVCTGVVLFARFSANNADFDARVRATYPGLPGVAFIALVALATVVAMLTTGLLLQLLAFHSYLSA